MKSSRKKPTLDGPAVCAVKGPGELDESWADSDDKMRVTVERSANIPNELGRFVMQPKILRVLKQPAEMSVT
jgi:hypothetical protein